MGPAPLRPLEAAPYDAGDVIAIDQLAGSEWLKPAELDALELSELEQLTILSDFCHPKRAAMQDVLGPIFRTRELAHQSGGQWRLREAGLARLRALQEADRAPPAPVALTEPYRSPQPSLFDCPAPEIVDGALQTRLPIDDDELAEQLAMIDIAAGNWRNVDPDMRRHLVGARLCALHDRQSNSRHRARPRVSRAAGRAGIRSTARGGRAMKLAGWIQTYTGKKFWPLDPRPEDVDIEDIAHALAMQCRFGGHCLRFYSNAEHSFWCPASAATTRSRACCTTAARRTCSTCCRRSSSSCRITRPPKNAARLRCIARSALPETMPASVKQADRRALRTERLRIMRDIGEPWVVDNEQPLDAEIVGWAPLHARGLFLSRFAELTQGQS
jgi:hypothetical protein